MKKEPKIKMVQKPCRLPEEVADSLVKISKRQSRTFNDLLRAIIYEWINNKYLEREKKIFNLQKAQQIAERSEDRELWIKFIQSLEDEIKKLDDIIQILDGNNQDHKEAQDDSATM